MTDLRTQIEQLRDFYQSKADAIDNMLFGGMEKDPVYSAKYAIYAGIVAYLNQILNGPREITSKMDGPITDKQKFTEQ